jgi:hypothetical protein
VIQVWFAAVVLIAVAATALGVSMTMGTAALLLAMCLVPPAVVFRLWPSDQPSTMAELIRESKTR